MAAKEFGSNRRRSVASLAVIGIDRGVVGRFNHVIGPDAAWDFVAVRIPCLIEQGLEAAGRDERAEEFELNAEETAAATVMVLTLVAGEPPAA